MCGISGIIGHNCNLPQLESMVKIQHHRGPDAEGYYLQENEVGLGHNRLSILDLSEAGNQPMKNHVGDLIIVFNGEVYNYLELKEELRSSYPFKTQTDTEVVLAAYQQWGAQCLQRFNGMFAFAIWDTKNKKLFAARDRFGVKPFHYGMMEGDFYFASEIKALWAAGFPKKPNETVWASYLTYGTYGMPNETFWEGIDQLPGGHYLEWEQGNISIHKWYDFQANVNAIPTLTEEEVKQQWTALAQESISLRFRSDVPVGFNLSGGLDSSLLLALVHRQFTHNRKIQAFTFFTGDERYDELPWVEEMIKLTDFPLNPVKLSATEVPELAEKVQWFEDEPFGGIPTLAYSKIFEKARELGTIVLLDGQGMDEAWAGYDYYLKNSGALVQGSDSSPVRPECVSPIFRKKAVHPDFPKPFDNELQNLQYRDLFYTKIPRALRFNDRISMMHSTELREPFLDHRLVELAFSLPPEMKIKNGQRKWLARQIAQNYLPGKVSLAPKRPLQTPQREWLAGSLSDWAVAGVQKFAKSSYSNPSKLAEVWNKFLIGGLDNTFWLWQWINWSLQGNTTIKAGGKA